MKKLKLNLQNCYGIRCLKYEFDLTNTRHVAIYAPNGTMKSSFARTFKDISDGEDSKDHLFNRTTVRKIKNENDAQIQQDSVLVIESHLSDDMAAASVSILVNELLKKEYDSIMADLYEKKTNLIKSLSKQSGLRGSTERAILQDFARDESSPENIFQVIQECLEIDAPTDRLANIKYNGLFNDSVLQTLDERGIREQLQEYVRKYKELVLQSPYLSMGFDHKSAHDAGAKLDTLGFFNAKHSINLNSKNGEQRTVVHSQQELCQVVESEKAKIWKEMKDQWTKIDKAISKNKELQEFRKVVADNNALLEMWLDCPDQLRRHLWRSYLDALNDQAKATLDAYRSSSTRIEDIVKQAKNEKSRWDAVVTEFNNRFRVPFKVRVTDRQRVVLEGTTPTLEFDYCDGPSSKSIRREELQRVMSSGEARALYILNVLFKIEKIIKDKQETVIVLDDVVDSFDYANKYVILQYLKEISKKPFLHMIILTHNFDFFRAIPSRNIVGRDNCYYASKANEIITFKVASNIERPLTSITQPATGIERDENLISAIPFARNLIEYTKEKKSRNYLALTSLLHWRTNTRKIKISYLQSILFTTIRKPKTDYPDESESVYDLIIRTAERCQTPARDSLFSKIVLAVAIRIEAERFMFFKLGKRPSRQTHLNTHKLIELCEAAGVEEIDVLKRVGIMTPSIIHLNAFMYEPIVDMDHEHLGHLFREVHSLASRTQPAPGGG